MAKSKPYRKTPVTIERSRAEMLKLMRDYEVLDPSVEIYPPYFYRKDGQRTSPLQSQGGAIHAEFQWPGQPTSARYQASLGNWEQGDKQNAEEFRKDINQELRIAGRTMYYMLKSTFEFIVAGFLREQVALFSWTVLPDGTTVAEKSDGDLAKLISPGTPLISAKAGPMAHGSDITRRGR